MIWPPDYTAEFARRLANRNKLMGDVELQRQFQIHYKHNFVDWCNDWAITFDPRNKSPIPRLLPFRLFPRQVDFANFLLSCLRDKENGLGEKSRDMGVTWEACAFAAWLWLYWDGSIIGFGSRKESYVDKIGDPKAILPKIRQILEYLPPWMMPAGFRMSVHATYMRIINPQNGSAILGEAGENMGRGGRTTIYFKDESAHYENPEMIEAALGDNTDVQIDMSSVNGSANVFYRKRMAGEVWYPDKECTPGKTRVFIFDWRDNPLKTLEWYLKRKARAMAEGLLHIFAQEVDRDYSGSVDKVIIKAEWSRACIDAHIKLGITPDGPKRAGQDVADGGGDKNALGISHGVILKHLEHWGGEAGDAARHAIPICLSLGVQELSYDSIGVGTGYREAIQTMQENNTLPARLRISPWNGGGKVLDPEDYIIPGDDNTPTNEQQYANLKAQSYWRLRARIYKTYRAVTFGDIYPHEELISFDSSIACVQQLIMELSQPVHKSDGKGKTLVDKKPKGAISPNLADCVNILYNPTREISIFDVL